MSEPDQRLAEAIQKRNATFDYSGCTMEDLARSFAAEIEALQHFKAAYARVLKFVNEQHFAGQPMTPDADPFFCSDVNNCATDVLLAEYRKLEALIKPRG